MNITSIGHGKFTATNGVDTLSAEYERGKKGEDGKFHPHWNFRLNGVSYSEYIGKSDAIIVAERLLTEPIATPLSRDASIALQQRDNCVHGIVAIEIGEIIWRDLDEFLELINARLSPLPLCDVSYRAVGMSEDGLTLHLRVNGTIDTADLPEKEQMYDE